jgi:hypothetical protein
MKLTIIREDGAVYKDGISYAGLNLLSVPNNVHALQWYETEGEIEFIANPDRTKPQNEIITELPAWANACVDNWNEAKIAEEAAILAAEQAAAAAEALKVANQSVTNIQTA